jgi:hypothetical protein
VTLYWRPPAKDGGANITGYSIVWIPVGITNGSRCIGNITSNTIGGLTDNVSYNFSVAAWNSVGEGSFTAPFAVFTGDAPAAPGNLTAIAGNATITATWSAPPPPRVYPILQYQLNVTPKNGTPVLYQDVHSPTTVTGLANGVLYLVSVRALNAVGWGDPSEFRGVTPAVPPSPAVGFTATFISSNDSLLVTWSPPLSDGGAAVDGYTLQWAATNGLTGTSFVGASTLEFTIKGVALGAKYTISITPQNSVGTGLTLAIVIPIPVAPPVPPIWAPYILPIGFFVIMLCTFLILLTIGRHMRSRKAGQ